MDELSRKLPEASLAPVASWVTHQVTRPVVRGLSCKHEIQYLDVFTYVNPESTSAAFMRRGDSRYCFLLRNTNLYEYTKK